jgi:hypothetical protein
MLIEATTPLCGGEQIKRLQASARGDLIVDGPLNFPIVIGALWLGGTLSIGSDLTVVAIYAAALTGVLLAVPGILSHRDPNLPLSLPMKLVMPASHRACASSCFASRRR